MYFKEELSGEVIHVFTVIRSNMLKIYLLRCFSDFPSSNGSYTITLSV